MSEAPTLDNTDTARQPAPYPQHLLIEAPYANSGVKRVKTDRWYKKEYHDREVERIWKKCWQMVCREEEIPKVGDYIIYDIAHLSFIVMRIAENEFHSYWNSCPHRSRKLKTCDGHGVPEIRCMFHGFSWHLDGSVKDIPCRWDFPGVSDDEAALVQAKTATWGGWVFLNPDPVAELLTDFLGSLPDHFEGSGHDMAKRWKQVHVAAVVECNWKIAQEAFIEVWHVGMTHPQWALAGGGESLGNRWDDFGNWIRYAPARSTDKRPPKPSDWGSYTDDPQLTFDNFFDRHLNDLPLQAVHTMEEGRQIMFHELREHYRAIIGDKVDDYHDYEFMCADTIAVFPNFNPWGGLSRIVYRYRPYGDDPERCIMEVMLFSIWPEDKPKPKPADIQWLKPNETTADALGLGQLGRVFLQDITNMHAQQLGVKSNGNGYVILSDHNETPVRKFHDLYDKWMGLEEDG